MQKRFFHFVILTAALSVNYFAQVSLPRESPGASVSQTVGDTQITIVYHRPNVKGRKIWGELVPFGEVWRAGANENTTFEVSRDVFVNGQPLPKGKYGFHIIPDRKEWILIFNKVNNAWGSFNYDEKQDSLRIKVVPKVSEEMRESLMYEFASVTPRSTEVVMSWEKIRVFFTIDIGDIFDRKIAELREAIEKRQPDDVRPLNAAANYIYTFRLRDKYTEALNWIEQSIKVGETFGNLAVKARLLADSGKTSEAIVIGEKAVQVGKTSNPPANPNAIAAFVSEIQKWKSSKK